MKNGGFSFVMSHYAEEDPFMMLGIPRNTGPSGQFISGLRNSSEYFLSACTDPLT